MTDLSTATPLTEHDSWKALARHHAEVRDTHLRTMFEADPQRGGRLAAEGAGLGSGPVQVAELSAPFSPQEVILRDALGLGDDVEVNLSGGALAANPVMVTGLVRVIEAARQVTEQGRDRVLAHATGGQALQQNLVCILEGSRA